MTMGYGCVVGATALKIRLLLTNLQRASSSNAIMIVGLALHLPAVDQNLIHGIRFLPCLRHLVTVLGDVDDDGLFPAEQEVTEGSTQHHRQTEPRVVGHEDQHQ